MSTISLLCYITFNFDNSNNSLGYCIFNLLRILCSEPISYFLNIFFKFWNSSCRCCTQLPFQGPFNNRILLLNHLTLFLMYDMQWRIYNSFCWRSKYIPNLPDFSCYIYAVQIIFRQIVFTNDFWMY